MTTYILKCTFKQLLEKELTQKILYIMKNSGKKKLTKKEISDRCKQRYGESFKVDSKGHTIIRYLKTMKRYGLVEEEKQGSGQPSRWILIKFSSKLDRQITISDHINRLKTFLEIDDYHMHAKASVTIYGFTKSYLEWESSEETYLENIFRQYKMLTKELSILQELMGVKLSNNIKKHIFNSPYSQIDKYIAMIYIVTLKDFPIFFKVNKHPNELDYPVSFRWFERDEYGNNIFPFVVKPDLKLRDIFCQNIYVNLDREEVWNLLNGYELDEGLCYDLINLHNAFIGPTFRNLALTIVCQLNQDDYKERKEDCERKRRSGVFDVECLDQMIKEFS